jgi:ectoine hydroxylase
MPMSLMHVGVPANTCVIFDRRLLHAGSANCSADTERQVIFIGYGYRWLRSKDVMDVEAALCSPEAVCPVVKQMLGWTHTNNGIFSPAAEDVPLR